MEKTNNLKYLRNLTNVFLALYVLFILMNFLEALWHGLVQFINGVPTSAIYWRYYEGKVHFWANILNYILHFVFLLAVNRYVKKQHPGTGYYFLIILIAFIPLVNYFLFYIIWRKLNEQLFVQFGVDWVKSDRKIKVIWILDVISILYLIVVPLSIYFLHSPEWISTIQYFSSFGKLAGKICYLAVSVIYLFYFLELKRVLNTSESNIHPLKETSLLDN